MTDTPPPTVETPPPTAPASSEPPWAKPAIAAGYTVCFVVLAIAAYLRNDTPTLSILTGVSSALLTQAGSYYFGSSSGSSRKTELLASAPATSKGSTP